MEHRIQNEDIEYFSYIKYNYCAILVHLISSIVMLFLYIDRPSLIIPY